MDQRQQPPPHPFSRNTASSPYNRNPFPPSSNQSPFPPSSHAPAPTPSYAEHQRRPSDPPYYNPQRSYGQDGPPMAGPGHVRHQSASSVGHGTSANRTMPPPSSPQQDRQQHTNYGPPNRAPLPGGPTSFSSGRELPALGQRSGMSISDILGGPSVSREQAPSYGSPITTAGPSPSMFAPSRGSPRNPSTGPDYAPFRRPQTPEHQRFSGPRDHRANSAGSPPNTNMYSTPEARQFGPPYRGQIAEERRDIRNPNPSSVPPRPNSQPSSYNPPPQRGPESRVPLSDFARRIEHIGSASEQPSRTEPQYQRPAFEERHEPRFGFSERERQERERERMRERDLEKIRERERQWERERDRDREQRRREIMIQHDMEAEREEREQRELRERAEQEMRQEQARQFAQRNPQPYGRPPGREQPAWVRPQAPYEPSRPSYEQPVERTPPRQPSNGHEYPGTMPPQYGGHPSYSTNEQRYPQTSQAASQNPAPTSQYEASTQERHLRLAQAQQQQLDQTMYGSPAGSGQYQSHESPARRTIEEAQHVQQQRNFLGVQEINRKGRLSPLPQAVQGAQSQMNGPGGEPSIKNEFGRMFSGIGSGVGSGMGAPSPVGSGPQGMPFSNTNQMRRDDLENVQTSPVENGGPKISRTASRGGSRRRKLKEEDSRGDDESSAGRRTPSGRGKRTKTHHHHHHHHHHHRPDPLENISPPNLTPFKSVKGAAIPSPPGLEKEVPSLHHHHVPISRPHHHHHHVNAKPTVQVNPQIPLPTITIVSTAVLDAVKNLPRRHIGHGYYDSKLKPTSSTAYPKKGQPGFSSTPKPLPRFEGHQLNCTYTLKVPRVYLTTSSLREITARKALWGTDVYTDDSDVIAACIHAGWFRGAWDESVDVSLLGLELPGKAIPKKIGPNGDVILLQPPPSGPEDIPKNHDVHIDVVVLPLLQGYGTTVRFGIRSREWGIKREGFKAQHDGLSFMIDKVTFVSSVGEGIGGGIRKMKKHLKNTRATNPMDPMEEIKITESGNGRRAPVHANCDESSEGAKTSRDIKGIGTNGWWLESNSAVKETEKTKETESPEAPKSSPPPPPRTPPRHQPTRNYVPIDPPIPSPISVIDPLIDAERAAELMADAANVTPSKAAGEDTAMEEVISPPRPVPDIEPPALPRRESAREIISASHGFGGDVAVKREVINSAPDLSVETSGAEVLDGANVSEAAVSKAEGHGEEDRKEAESGAGEERL